MSSPLTNLASGSITLAQVPLGMRMNAAQAAISNVTWNSLNEQFAVAEQFADFYKFELPDYRSLSGFDSLTYYQQETAPLFAKRMRPHFDSALNEIARSNSPHLEFERECLYEVFLPDLVMAGLATYDAVDGILVSVIESYESVIAGTRLEGWMLNRMYELPVIILRLLAYMVVGALSVVEYRETGSISAFALPIGVMNGGEIVSGFVNWRMNRESRNKVTMPLQLKLKEVADSRGALSELKDVIERRGTSIPLTHPESRGMAPGEVIPLPTVEG